MRATRFLACRAGKRDRLRMGGQRGAVSVLAAVWLLVVVVVMGAIDIGNVFYQRRDLQRIADMAALAAVQSIDPSDTNCTASNAAALKNAGINDSNTVSLGGPANGQDQITPTCGRWDTQDNANLPAFYARATKGMTQINAAQVTVTRNAQYSFLGVVSSLNSRPSTISATSTARASAIDTFSISATLASVDPVWLNSILSALLGANVNLTLADYQSLASANIKLGGLAAAVRAGSVSGLVGLPVSMSTLVGTLNTYVGAVQPGTNDSPGYVAQLRAGSPALGKIAQLGITNASVVLANQANAVLQISLGNPDSGADATVSLLDLLMTAAQVANKSHAVSLNTGAGLPLGSTIFKVVNVQLQVLNPPSIAIGEAGQLGNGAWRTQASSAQIGLYLNVQTPTISLSTCTLLSPLGLCGLLNISASLSGINLPIYLLVGGPAVASLAATKCGSATTPSTTTIIATPGIARLCLSNPPSGGLNLSDVASCPAAGTLQLLNLKASATLLGIGTSESVPVSATIANPLLQIVGKASASAPFSGYSSVSPYHFCNAASGLTAPVSCGSGWVNPTNAGSPDSYWTTYSNNLGSELGTALGNINLNSVNILGVSIPTGALLNLIGGQILSPVLSALDSVIVPLLGLLGVQVGQATVHQISLTCNAAQLVN